MIRRLTAVLLAVGLTMGMSAGGVHAFGTVNHAGQHAEHEKITRAALWCKARSHPRECFEDFSIRLLAGANGALGAVGAPDVDSQTNAATHCDEADYFDKPGYPQSRKQATQALINCRRYALTHLERAVQAAKGMLDKKGRLKRSQVDVSDCGSFVSFIGGSSAAKCAVLNQFGRTLHTAEDFYSHTTWAGRADPSKPVGIDNPPGLDLVFLSSLFDYNAPPTIPKNLSGGCFTLNPLKNLSFYLTSCRGRVTHATVNKDEGIIDPRTGAASHPDTPRGKIGSNFANAVFDAVHEAARQWRELQQELIATYGKHKGKLMICALTRDYPTQDCELKLTVEGTERVTWTYDENSTNLCEHGQSAGNGYTTIRFKSTHPVYANAVDLVPPEDATASNRGVILPTRGRYDSHGYVAGNMVGCGGCSGAGCGAQKPPDCGFKTAGLALEVRAPGPDRLTLENRFGQPHDPYSNCPSGFRTRGTVGPNDGELEDDDLYDEDVGAIIVTGKRRHHQARSFTFSGINGTDTITVKLDWTLTIEKKPRQQGG